MGVGKSVVGRALAARTRSSFVDLDAFVGDIPAIFARVGEAGFRDAEHAALAQVVKGEGVISLGGGSLGFERNQRCLADWTVVVLMARPETLATRLGDEPGRPLMGQWRERLAERMPVFLSYGPPVDTDERSVDDVVTAVLSRLP